MSTETTCRITLAALVVLMIIESGYYRLRAERQGGHVSLRNDSKWFWLIVALSMVPLMFGIISFIVNPAAMSFSALPLADSIRLSGIPLGMVALLGTDWMFRHLGHNVTKTSMPREDATLVTTGPYRWIRHPMYSFGMMLFLAFTLLTANWLIGICSVTAFCAIIVRVHREESRLIDKFGDAYRKYKKQTGRFLPRIHRLGYVPRTAG